MSLSNAKLSMRQVMNGIQEQLRLFCVAVFENEGLDVKVILAERSVPQPPYPPYVAMKMLTGLVKVGSLDEKIRANNTDAYRVRAYREFTASFSCVGKASEYSEDFLRGADFAASLQLAMDLPSFRDILRYPTAEGFEGGSLTPIVDANIADATIDLETDWEPRAVYDVTFAVAFETTDDISNIDTIQFQGAVDTNMDGSFDKQIGPKTVS